MQTSAVIFLTLKNIFFIGAKLIHQHHWDYIIIQILLGNFLFFAFYFVVGFPHTHVKAKLRGLFYLMFPFSFFCSFFWWLCFWEWKKFQGGQIWKILFDIFKHSKNQGSQLYLGHFRFCVVSLTTDEVPKTSLQALSSAPKNRVKERSRLDIYYGKGGENCHLVESLLPFPLGPDSIKNAINSELFHYFQ